MNKQTDSGEARERSSIISVIISLSKSRNSYLSET